MLGSLGEKGKGLPSKYKQVNTDTSWMTGSYPALPHDIHHRIEDLYVYSIPPPNYDKKGGQELLL